MRHALLLLAVEYRPTLWPSKRQRSPHVAYVHKAFQRGGGGRTALLLKRRASAVGTATVCTLRMTHSRCSLSTPWRRTAAAVHGSDVMLIGSVPVATAAAHMHVHLMLARPCGNCGVRNLTGYMSYGLLLCATPQ